MDTIMANVKAFMRPQKLEWCLRAIRDAGIEKILVGYDGPDNLVEEHRDVCGFYNAEFIRLPFNNGLARTRNDLIEMTDTNFLLQVDDDNYVPSNILDVMPFMHRHRDIGVVGFGWVTEREHPTITLDAADWDVVNGYLLKTVKDCKIHERSETLIVIYPFEYVPNCAIFRSELFNDVQWDPEYIIGGEHLDFYLNIKFNAPHWKGAICASTFVIHDPFGDKQFQSFRWGDERFKSERRFLKKWGLKGVVGWKRMIFDSGAYSNVYQSMMQSEEDILRKEAIGDKIPRDKLNYAYLYGGKKGGNR